MIKKTQMLDILQSSAGMEPKTILSLLVVVTSAQTSPSCTNPDRDVLPEYRLKGDVVPLHYNLQISTDLECFTFEGKVWIHLKCVAATDTIYLHSKNLTIQEQSVTLALDSRGADLQDAQVSGISYEVKNDLMLVKLRGQVTPGRNYILYIPFVGNLSQGLTGYYRSSYFDKTLNSTRWLAVTQFQPTSARTAFPCFDEPSMKATFSLKLAHAEGLRSVSNMPLTTASSLKGKPGWVLDEFQNTVPMSTYLVAFLVSDFEYRESDPQPNKVVFRIWARREAIDQVEFARSVGPNLLSYYEHYFHVEYPLPKQDMVAIPDFSAQAMENWGLITYRESTLLEEGKSEAGQSEVAWPMAHELAHQWFGNLVTMRWWTDLWLNEGFATYVAGLGLNHEFPSWNALDGNAVDSMLAVLLLDSLASSHPVSVPIGHHSQILEIFDPISYKKGAMVLRMLSMFLGEEVFREAVSEYLKTHRFGNAEQDDLWSSLTEQAHKTKALPEDMTVKQIMDSWTLQPGYPIVLVKRDYTSGRATFSQKRYLAMKPKKKDKSCWWVPLTYATARNHNFAETSPRDWLRCGRRSVSLDIGAAAEDWLVVNNRFEGLFRVNYDDRNWRLIAAALSGPQLTRVDVLNRVQVVADVLDLARRGDVTYHLAFRLLRYLVHEPTYLPWRSALEGLGRIDRVLLRTSLYGDFRKYMRILLDRIYLSFGEMKDVPRAFEEGKLQNLILYWACRYRVGDCVLQAGELFSNWTHSQDPDDLSFNPIPKSLRGMVYCQGVMAGGEEAWNFLWSRYKRSNLGSEQSIILGALGCSQEVWLLNRYLDWSIRGDAGIRRQDSYSVFESVARNDVGYYLARRFLMRNVKQIHDYHGPRADRLGRYILAIAKQMVNKDDLSELKKFTRTHKALLERCRLSVGPSLETVQVNIAWLDRLRGFYRSCGGSEDV